MLPKEIRVLIVDDHQMIRDGVCTMLESKSDRCKFIISESDSGEDAIYKVRENDYDIVFMDYQLPGLTGAETVHQLLSYKPEMKILAMSNYDELSYIKNMMDSGAKGYVLKNITPTELLTAIESILNGKHYYSNEIAEKLAQSKSSDENRLDLNRADLTNRQIQVLKGIASGRTTNEIAKDLHITKSTVSSHRQTLTEKLGVKNRVGLIKYAIKFALFDQSNGNIEND